MTDLAQMAPGEGNTISSPIGKVKRVSGSKRWPFTWNNYPEDWVAQMAPGLDRCDWIGVPEVGESGTPHIQGYVEFPVKVRPIGYKGMPKEIHWGDEYGKPAKGTRAHNIGYCTKGPNNIPFSWTVGKEGNLKVPRQMKFPWENNMKDWQKDILEMIKEDPNDRGIHWYYGDGNIGKTDFCKYLCARHNGIVLSGKGADVRNAVCTYLKDTGEFPELCIFPIPMSFNTEYLSYESLENVKDMFFYSGKYEGGAVNGPRPHVLVFANSEPDYSKMKADRWVVKEIS